MNKIFFVLLLLSGCGQNTAAEKLNKDRRSGDVVNEICGAGNKINASGGRWRVTPQWIVGPRMGAEELTVNSLCLTFEAAQGGEVASLQSVQVTAWMPEHGHDTGREKPEVETMSAQSVKVSNIWFIMTGRWEFIVKAEMNGLADVTRFDVTVGE